MINNHFTFIYLLIIINLFKIKFYHFIIKQTPN